MKLQFRSRLPKIVLSGFFVVLAVTAATGLSSSKAYAVTASDWNAGNIIDDNYFYNNADMSTADIQNFLNSKMPSCDTSGSKIYSGNQTRAQYGASRGYPAPYVCLKDYYENTTTHINNLSGSTPAGAISAAQIIKNAADTYGISSKTIIVLLQKEQTLVTDDWPWGNQYRSATGYGCPDTAACDSQYYGFYNQVTNAARQFRLYANNPANYRYKPYQYNTVQYNPNAACGSSSVYISNKATAGLYNYTPYQPNASALSNLYGSGDSCGAYGNRNFWRLFNDWFGSTNTPAFRATFDTQSSYPVVDTGVGISIFFQFKNTGTAFWKDDRSTFPGYSPVHFATTRSINRVSSFRADNWLSAARPTGTFAKVYEADGVTLASDQHTVQPGQIARFEFTISVSPSTPPGVYREYFQPILEGAPGYSWNMGGEVYLDIGVNRPQHKAAYVGQSAYPTVTRGGVAVPAFISFRNIGDQPWFDSSSTPTGKRPIHLATSWPINRASNLGSNWSTVSRPSFQFSKVYNSDGSTLSAAQHTVQPGQIARFDFNLAATSTQNPGQYREYFQPIVEGAPGQDWDMGITAWLGVTVQ